MAGTYWMALAPVPMDATRSPPTDVEWSHREEWKARPANRSAPGISGTWGTLSMPSPLTSTPAVNVSPEWAVRIHCWDGASHRAWSIRVPVRTWGRTPYRSVHRSR